MYYVYLHTNLINNKKYCGMTNDAQRRWRCGGIEYKPHNNDKNRPFWNAIVKYGWENFKSEILAEFDNKEDAGEYEEKVIKQLNLRNRKNGYNIAKGGSGGIVYIEHPRGMLGKPQTEYNNKCCRQRFTVNNPMQIVKWDETHPHPRGMLGKKHTIKVKQKISEKLKGKTFSEERNKKISETLKGVEKTEEHRKKLSESKKQFHKNGGKVNCAKDVQVIYPDGRVNTYTSIKKLCESEGFSRIVYYKLVDKNIEYIPPKNNKELEKYKGIKIKTIVNTEVN